jgi:hypothetical protein
MKNLFTPKNIIIVSLSAIVVVMGIYMVLTHNKLETSNIPQPQPKTITDTVRMVHDSLIYLDGDIIQIEKITEVPAIVDTTTILKKFYDKNFHKDTIELSNNLGFVFINDSISQNEIFKRTFTFNLNEPVKEEPIIIPPTPLINQVYFGVNGQLNQKDQIGAIGLGLMLKTNKEKIFNVTFGVSNKTLDGKTGEFIPYVGGGVYWKIKLKE